MRRGRMRLYLEQETVYHNEYLNEYTSSCTVKLALCSSIVASLVKSYPAIPRSTCLVVNERSIAMKEPNEA